MSRELARSIGVHGQLGLSMDLAVGLVVDVGTIRIPEKLVLCWIPKTEVCTRMWSPLDLRAHLWIDPQHFSANQLCLEQRFNMFGYVICNVSGINGSGGWLPSVSWKSSSQVGFVYFQAWDPCPMLISHSSLSVVSYRSSLTKLSQLSFLEWGCHVNQLATPHGESSGAWLFRHPPVRPIIIAKATDQAQRGWYNQFFVDTSFDWCRCLVLWLQPQESIARLRRISTFEGASASSTLDYTRTELMECAWWQMPWTPLAKHEGAAASHEFSWMIIEQLRALFFRSALAGLSPCHWDFASPFSILPRL